MAINNNEAIIVNMIIFNQFSDPVYDEDGTWQVTSTDNGLSSPDLLSHIDTTSFSTHHYVFLTHVDEPFDLDPTYVPHSYNVIPSVCNTQTTSKSTVDVPVLSLLAMKGNQQ